jgi:hypothetical protein
LREILDRQVSHMVRLVDDLLEGVRASAAGRITLQAAEHVRLAAGGRRGRRGQPGPASSARATSSR